MFFFLLLFVTVPLLLQPSFGLQPCTESDECRGCTEDGDSNPLDETAECTWCSSCEHPECRTYNNHCQVAVDSNVNSENNDEACCCYHNPGQWEYFCTTRGNCAYHGDTCEDSSNCENSCTELDADDSGGGETSVLLILVAILPLTLWRCYQFLFKKNSKNVRPASAEQPNEQQQEHNLEQMVQQQQQQSDTQNEMQMMTPQ